MILCDSAYGTTACKWDTVIPFEPLWVQYEGGLIKDTRGDSCLTASQPFTTTLINSNLLYFDIVGIGRRNNSTGFMNANKMPLRNVEEVVVFYRRLPTYRRKTLWQ